MKNFHAHICRRNEIQQKKTTNLRSSDDHTHRSHYTHWSKNKLKNFLYFLRFLSRRCESAWMKTREMNVCGSKRAADENQSQSELEIVKITIFFKLIFEISLKNDFLLRKIEKERSKNWVGGYLEKNYKFKKTKMCWSQKLCVWRVKNWNKENFSRRKRQIQRSLEGKRQQRFQKLEQRQVWTNLEIFWRAVLPHARAHLVHKFRKCK